MLFTRYICRAEPSDLLQISLLRLLVLEFPRDLTELPVLLCLQLIILILALTVRLGDAGSFRSGLPLTFEGFDPVLQIHRPERTFRVIDKDPLHEDLAFAPRRFGSVCWYLQPRP